MAITLAFVVSPLFGVLFFAVWLAVMGSFLYFRSHVAPSALHRWAQEEGYRIIEQKTAGPFEWYSFARGSGHWVYRVAVQDNDGQILRGLVRVGTPCWFRLDVSRCPVEARWDSGAGKKEASGAEIGFSDHLF